MNQIYKYPRTKHLSGSKIQPGDEDLDNNTKFELISNKNYVIEEKMDGANSAISFIGNDLKLQSRGHYLTGGYRERHFDLFKTWANNWTYQLRNLLGERYVMYGEWIYAKHTIYYDNLPHYWMEFDIFDTEKGIYLDTNTRHNMLKDYNFIHSVKVLENVDVKTKEDLYNKISNSYFITENHIKNLEIEIKKQNLDIETIKSETDLSPLMEGLYIKVEEDGIVKERYKFVRQNFLQVVSDSETHWLDRPIIPNKLNCEIDKLFI